ncbi:suppressor of los1-1 [Coemansia thaxteri]|uniref:6-phosphogluconolactonase n=1 Tax=Coemansia thaxteri TaxID=2663907 RepID=A0A9W8BLI2_9FUNG|nr:suppressor of los1-1 [Coemansia thaxteri]KAJ2477415.1 suppressor of los1-1 [Coemansia sp. RSA 2320]
MSTKVYSFSSTNEVAQGLDKLLAHLSSEAIARSGRFTVAFSGGSLPATVAKYVKHNSTIDFSKWFVFWADERCVDHSDSESNYRLVKEELLDHVPIPAKQVFAIDPTLLSNSAAAAAEYQSQMVAVFDSVPVFDCILLGIGPDGHTCSLFPGHPQIEENDKWVVHIDDSPKPPPSRITLTLPVLNHARTVAFVATGAGKRGILREIIDDRNLALPASHVAPTNGSALWFVDHAAAQDLKINKPAEFKL